MVAISTLLVANRGEIALRIMRSARALGMRCVAVYSDADAAAPHVAFADDGVRLGPAPAGESYLRGDAIVAAAQASGAEAIHPGYGFLSENAAFARACAVAGLIFVGPPAHAIDVMGDKARAKRAMIDAGVPCVPGYQGEAQDSETLIAEAKTIGFPLMVKAAAGGGGRGMRLVERPRDLPAAFDAARSEARNAFGSGDLILEKAIAAPRHVEIQVFADGHGSCIHLGERDCSVQRRHQKVIEEAPCPVLTPDLRAAMGAAAIAAARAVDYRGAGTVEFLLDRDGAFFFLEMNTRLQVEHPVTEMVTGLDLVALQLAVAQGEALGIAQADVAITGHAIEARLYAEDPAEDFLPSTGPIALWYPPEGEGVRVDAGIASGGEVSPFYDSMVAKIVAHGATRDQARRRLIGALERTALFGPHSNRDFLLDALRQDSFARGEATTAFIDEAYGEAGFAAPPPDAETFALAAVLQHRLARCDALSRALPVNAELLDWSNGGRLASLLVYRGEDGPLAVAVAAHGGDHYAVTVGDRTLAVAIRSFEPPEARLSIDSRGVTALFARHGADTLHIVAGGHSLVLANRVGGAAASEEAGEGIVTAPMHGLLLDIAVGEGDRVAKGQTLATLEAMKMQHRILAGIDGIVGAVSLAAGAQIAAGERILEIHAADGDVQ